MDEEMVRGTTEVIDLLDILFILLKRTKFIMKITSAIALITVIVSLILPNIYEGTATLLPSQRSSAAGALLGQISSAVALTGGLPGAPSPSDVYVAMLESRSILDAIVDRFQLMNLYQCDTRIQARKALADVADIASDPKSGIITINVLDEDPQRAADMANAFVEELIKLQNNLNFTDARRRRVFFEDQLKITHTALSRAEEDLRKFQETTGVIKPDSQAGSVFDAIGSLRAQIAAREVQIKVLRTYSTPQNRSVRQLEEEVAGIKEQLKKLESGGTQFSTTSIPTDEIPTFSVEYMRLIRELKFQETLFGIIMNQYESARLDEASEAATIQVVSSAVVPDRKAKPKRALMVIFAAAAGFFFSTCAAFFAEYLHRASSHPERHEKLDRIKEQFAPIMNSSIVNRLRRVFKRKSSHTR